MSYLSPIISLMLRGRKNAKLTILKYHRVLDEDDGIIPESDAQCFSWQMKQLKAHFNVLALPRAVHLLKEGGLPPCSVCITFDDGYADNCQVALPILLQYGLTATFFVSTGFLNGGMMWNDKIIHAVKQWKNGDLDLECFALGVYQLQAGNEIQVIEQILERLKYLPMDERSDVVEQVCETMHTKLPVNIMMTDQQVKKLHDAGMNIGGHTVNHPILTKINKKQAYDEIEQGKTYLEGILGGRLHSFAYPNGEPGRDYGTEHVGILKELGFACAVSTSWGVANQNTDLYQLPRMAPSTRNPLYFVGRILENTRIAPVFV